MSEILRTGYCRLVQGRHGRFLANVNDIYIGRSLIEYGEFSELEWRLLDQILKPGMIVVEAGANIGAHTVPMARKVGIRGLVYAFEPQLSVFQQLCANLALNDLANVQAFHAACAAAPGWLPIVRPNPASRNNFGGIGLGVLRGESGVRIRIETLDEALDPPGLHLIKADVEGMEIDVLKGAAGLIARYRPLLYLEANEKDASDLIGHVTALGYDLWWHLPAMFNADNHFGKSENVFGSITSKNLLCTPAERQMRVSGARRVTGPDDHPWRWKRG